MQPVIEFSEELNSTQPPVLTDSAEQPHHCTDDQVDDECQHPTDNDDNDVSAPSLAGAEVGQQTPYTPEARSRSPSLSTAAESLQETSPKAPSPWGRSGFHGKKQRKAAKRAQSNAANSVTPRPTNWSSMSPQQRKFWFLHNK